MTLKEVSPNDSLTLSTGLLCWLDESSPATYNRPSSGGDPSPPGAIGQAAALQRRSTPSSGRQGQVDWTKRPRPLCQHRHPRYSSGLAPSLDCQQIRFEQETQTRSPADQGGHSRTGPANGTGKSVMGLHTHPTTKYTAPYPPVAVRPKNWRIRRNF